MGLECNGGTACGSVTYRLSVLNVEGWERGWRGCHPAMFPTHSALDY